MNLYEAVRIGFELRLKILLYSNKFNFKIEKINIQKTDMCSQYFYLTNYVNK